MTTGAYEPLFSDGTLPLPTGVFGTDIHARFSPEQQRLEAAKMLEMMKTTPSFDLGRLTLMHTPVPLLVQIPDTNKVRMIHGVAPYLGHPLSEPSAIEGTLLGIDGDIDGHGEIPRVIRLPTNLFTIKTITVPTQAAFETKITSKPRDVGTPWFRATQLQDSDKTTTDLAKTIPFPPYLAYDALHDDVPAHIIWERIRHLELPTEQPSQLFQEIKSFLSATHTRYIDSAPCVTLPTNTFTQRMTPDMKTWVKDRTSHIYDLRPSYSNQNPQQSPATTPQDLLQTLLQTLLQHQNNQNLQGAPATNPAQPPQPTAITKPPCEVMKKYGLCPSDFSRFLNMCGLADGQEELLPGWLARTAEKGLSKDGKYAILREACTDLIFDDNPIPLITKTLEMLVKKSWGGEGDTITSESVLQGLTPYTMVPKSEEEIERLNAAWQALQQATATTPKDILQTTAKLKVEVPTDFNTFYKTMRTFTNFVRCIFSSRSPFYIAMKTDIIGGLATWTDNAKCKVTPRTLACFTWATFKQSRHFAMGKMITLQDQPSDKQFVPEWRAMVINLRAGLNLDFLNLPQAVTNKKPTLPPTPAPNPTKRPLSDDPYRGSPSKRPTLPDERKMWIHPLIKSNITTILPRYAAISKLCTACKIRPGDIFPRDLDLCATGALTGRCTWAKCKRSHNGQAVTDDIAKKVLHILDPVIKDPTLLTQSG